ncbi:MAG: hypothetical protein ACTS5I_13445, partial [Rhodanobacter sp.]
EISSFDNSHTVWIEAHGTNCGMSMVCSMLGAQWTDSTPDKAMLVVQTMGSYAAITAAAVNIDGRIVVLPMPKSLTHYSQSLPQPSGQYNAAMAELGRTSTQGFDASLGLIRQILAAHSVKLRVQTSEVTIDSIVFTADKDSKAHHALKRFMAQVDAATP